MRWKLKAFVQNAIALLPGAASYSVYYHVQRRLGTLKKPYDPTYLISCGAGLIQQLCDRGFSPVGRVFFEVGAGRIPVVPITYWLSGAAKVITLDVNPHMREELLADFFDFVRQRPEYIETIFGDRLDRTRFNELKAIARQPMPLAAFLG